MEIIWIQLANETVSGLQKVSIFDHEQTDGTRTKADYEKAKAMLMNSCH